MKSDDFFPSSSPPSQSSAMSFKHPNPRERKSRRLHPTSRLGSPGQTSSPVLGKRHFSQTDLLDIGSPLSRKRPSSYHLDINNTLSPPTSPSSPTSFPFSFTSSSSSSLSSLNSSSPLSASSSCSSFSSITSSPTTYSLCINHSPQHRQFSLQSPVNPTYHNGLPLPSSTSGVLPPSVNTSMSPSPSTFFRFLNLSSPVPPLSRLSNETNMQYPSPRDSAVLPSPRDSVVLPSPRDSVDTPFIRSRRIDPRRGDEDNSPRRISASHSFTSDWSQSVPNWEKTRRIKQSSSIGDRPIINWPFNCLLRLPDPLLSTILSFFTIDTHFHIFPIVCSNFKRILRVDRQAWPTNINLRNFKNVDTILIFLSNFYLETLELDISTTKILILLKKFHKINSLRIHLTGTNPHKLFTCLQGLPITFLSIVRRDLSNNELMRLLPLPLLELEFCGCTFLEENILVTLKPLHKITSLDLSRTNIHDDDLKLIEDFPHLKILKLFGCQQITDHGLSYLPDYGQNLRELDLSGTLVSNKGLQFLCPLTKLEILNLSQCSGVSEGVKQLSVLPLLKKLFLPNKRLNNEILKLFGKGVIVWTSLTR